MAKSSKGANNLSAIGRSIGNALAGAGTYTAQAAARANGISWASQSAQGAFNQGSADLANAIGDSRTWDQYAYNSAQAAEANAFTEMMWDKAATYNTNMFNQQMAYNSKEAQINRDFQLEMDSTKYRRAVKDMKRAGLNPILAVTSGISAGSPTGTTASVSAPTMGGASGIAANGGLMNGISASEGNFAGQMEYMSGILGLISACMSGFSSAFGSLGSLGDLGEGLGNALLGAFAKNTSENNTKTSNDIAYNLGKNLHDKISNYWNSGEERRIEYYKNKYPGHGGNGYSR